MSDSQQPIITIFSGPNGAGKSTLCELFAPEQDLGFHIDTDSIARAKGISDLDAGRETLRLVHECIRSGISFSLETTLSGRVILDQMRQAKQHGFSIRLLFISLDSPLEHQTRVAQRAARGGHYIPPEDVERRYFRAHKNLSVAIMLADAVDLYTNTDRCVRVVKIANGKITKLVQDMPGWVEQALGSLSNFP